MTHKIRQSFENVSRHQRGVQNPVRTLELGSGSCRDLAVLMIAALRARGIAARFVSGYVHLADDDDDDVFEGGNMHAWVQVNVPGPGWVDFDPSSGVVGNRNLIRVAVAHHPREAIPLQGTCFGSASPQPILDRRRPGRGRRNRRDRLGAVDTRQLSTASAHRL